ncbi:DNA phosphorothioation-associated putative methyltransferase [uncultured Shewanella sp.]|uniref:DNA phosphorothioation-associated putative methyltransferase n=1 Tax=uncultured Shewanella sp. TaxID=173975 RepID=UPI002611038B|nr:DNA phosphorothioation-associated putative methyltransferase [uncultured Shewanella sp.]
MDADKFKQLVLAMPLGKKLPDAHYVHKIAFDSLKPELTQFIIAVGKALNIDAEQWHVAKLSKNNFKLSLLSYPDFFDESYPALTQSVTIDLNKLSHRITQYQAFENPPILHRKETMIPSSHPSYLHFKTLTQEGEEAGLYENTRIIGFKQSWEKIINKKGYQLIEGRLFKRSNEASDITSAEFKTSIDRHKTAIVRHELSAPMKQLAKQGFLNGDFSLFDYGCGQGGDLTELQAHGLDALGWDPNFQPDAEKVSSDLVNLGFIINVIEDQTERSEALLEAWALTQKLLVVSAMLANETYINQFKPYKDGVITSRNTFQKYYAQAELKGYIERVLDENAIAIAPGIYYIFRDKIEEQRFLASRHKRHHQWQQITHPTPTSNIQAQLLFTQYKPLLNAFWERCLALGRLPINEEFADMEALKVVCDNAKKAFALLLQVQDEQAKINFNCAASFRREDLLVYFALSQFEQHKGYQRLPDEQKRDIKVFFGTYKVAITEAKHLLFSIADTELIKQACLQAHKDLPASKMNPDHSLELHKHFIDKLPALLRVYVGAAIQLYGELDEIDLVKIHITSGKVSFMGYDNFNTSPLPVLRERIKVKMWQLDIDFFDYIDTDHRPPLIYKSQYLNEIFDDYKKQKSFDKRLYKEGIFEQQEKPNTLNQVKASLKNRGLEVRGYRFYRLE